MLFFVGTCLLAANAMADTSLPYIGPEASACKVNAPEGEMATVDAGYLTSEDCRVLYVKPPIKGVIDYVDSQVYGAISYCPLEVDARASLAEYRNITTSNTVSAQDRIAAVTLANIFEQQISNLYDSAGTVALLGANVNLNWAKMIKAYKDANPGIRDIRALPISFGGLSAHVKDNRINDIDEDSREDIVRRLVINGKKIEAANEKILNTFVPQDLQPLFLGTYAMGQSASMQLALNLKGACAMFNQDRSPMSRADVYFMPTYTYTYPVQTKSFFKITLDTSVFEGVLKNIAKSSNMAQVSVEELKSKIKNTSAVKITLNDGFAKVPSAVSLRDKYESEIKTAVIESFLNTASTSINRAKKESEYTVMERRTRRVCRRRLFWKSCSNKVYHVPVKKIDWAKVNRVIDRLGGEVSGGSEKYSTIHYMDTVVFDSESSEQ